MSTPPKIIFLVVESFGEGDSNFLFFLFVLFSFFFSCVFLTKSPNPKSKMGASTRSKFMMLDLWWGHKMKWAGLQHL